MPTASSSADPVEAPTDSSSDTCKITGARTVARAFRGTVMIESADRSGTGGELCHFVVHSSGAGVTVSVDMSLTRRESAAVFAQVEKQPGNTPVSGVGDAACFRAQTQTLAFRVGTTVVVMSATATPVTAARRSVMHFEQIVLGRQVAAEQ